ncbi:MAG TPA: quinolinate synthase NadA [Candidatus Coatesbacteria bacterium]|nr:quinolinate synthase NadA [Candidatus Coatesbacteria bacterium]
MPAPFENDFLLAEIDRLRRERGAVILAHNYQLPEVQATADRTGDSLGLARMAAGTDARVIVLAGVGFMAETAALLCPDKRVLLPELRAGCPMADMITADDLLEARTRFPELYVVTYVNSTAEVKAESDICCTSANAVEVLRRAPADRPVLFCPDRHLGEWAALQVGRTDIGLYPAETDFRLWPGFCPTHHRLTLEDLERVKAAHPRAEVMVHPECRLEVCRAADRVASTGGMLKYPAETDAREFIVGTEVGMLEPLRRAYPDRLFFPAAAEKMVCWNMKVTTLESVYTALAEDRYPVYVPEETAAPARRAIERMLAL